MKAVVCYGTEVPAPGIRRRERRPAARSLSELEASLLSEIGQLGGEARMRGAQAALEAFQAALTDLVRQNPQAYGAGEDSPSQDRVLAEWMESVSTSFLLRTVESLRCQAGYVQVCGRWVHRAVFTFIGFGLLVATVLPLCAVSLMSSSAWGWLPGTIGIVAAVLAGAWILSRIQSR